MKRRNISLDADTDARLARTGNASGWLSHVIRERWADWQNALRLLESEGWKPAELRAACDALNGACAPPDIAYALTTAARLEGVARKWEVEPKRWRSLVRGIEKDRVIALAVLFISREYWAGNAACHSALGEATSGA